MQVTLTLSWFAVVSNNSQYHFILNNQPYSLLGYPSKLPRSSNFTFLALNIFLAVVTIIVAVAAVVAMADAALAAWLAAYVFATSSGIS